MATKQSASSYTAVFEWKVSHQQILEVPTFTYQVYIAFQKGYIYIYIYNPYHPSTKNQHNPLIPPKISDCPFFIRRFFSARRKTAVAWRLKVVFPRMAAKVGSKMGSWEAVGVLRMMGGLTTRMPFYMFRMGKITILNLHLQLLVGGLEFRSRSNIFQYILRIKNPGKLLSSSTSISFSLGLGFSFGSSFSFSSSSSDDMSDGDAMHVQSGQSPRSRKNLNHRL